MAPHPPNARQRPGKAVALLVNPLGQGDPDTAPHIPKRSSRVGTAAALWPHLYVGCSLSLGHAAAEVSVVLLAQEREGLGVRCDRGLYGEEVGRHRRPPGCQCAKWASASGLTLTREA